MTNRHTMKLGLAEIALLLFCMSVVIFPNGSMIMRIIKVLFAVLSLVTFFSRGNLIINSHLKWLLAITLLGVLSFSWAESKSYALQGIFTIVLNFVCLFFVIQLSYYTDEWKKIVYFCLIVGPIFRLVYIIGEVGFSAFYGLRNISYYGYNTLGMFAALAIIFAYIAFYIEKIWVSKGIFTILTVINFSILMLSMSRKAIIYLAIPIVVYFLLSGNNIRKKIKRAFLMLFIFAMVVWAFLKIDFLYNFAGKGILDLVQHFLDIGVDQSAAGRDARIAVGLQYVEQRPWIGYGAMNFNYLFGRIENTDLLVADNNYIEILVSYGIFGFFIYYSYLFAHLFKLKKIISNKLKLMMYGLLLAFLVCDYGVSSYIYLHVQLFLCVICMTLDHRVKSN